MKENKDIKRYVWSLTKSRVATTYETEATLGGRSNGRVWDEDVDQWEDEAPTVELLLLKLTRRFLDG